MKEGLFYVVSRSLEELRKGNFTVFPFFDGNFGHRAVWELFKRNHVEFSRFDYEYFPRGRIWSKDGSALLFLDPVLNVPPVTERIKEIFEITGNYEIHSDGFVSELSRGENH